MASDWIHTNGEFALYPNLRN